MRTPLEETLMGLETYGTYSVSVYDKTATSYMFGYANSGFGKDFGLGKGFVTGLDIGKEDSLLQRFRADDHKPFGQHLNFELFPNPITPDINGNFFPLTNDHLPLGWKK